MSETRIDEDVLELSALSSDEELLVVTTTEAYAAKAIDLRAVEPNEAVPAPVAFEKLFTQFEALSFGDVVVVPKDADLEAREVIVRSTLASDVLLELPFVVSSSSCSVATAIAVARAGGIAVLPGNSGVATQAAAVSRVKRAHRAWIHEPIVLSHRATVGEALELWASNEISGAPVVDDLGRLIGMLTKRDVRFCTPSDSATSVRDLMSKWPALVTAPIGTTLSEARKLMQQNRYEKLPMVDEFGKLVALLTVKDLLVAEAHALASTDAEGRLKCAAAVGVGTDVLQRVKALVEAGVDAVVVGRPDGSFAGVADAVARIRRDFETLPIIAGRVSTAAGVRDLRSAGANAVSVGGTGTNGVTIPLLSTLAAISPVAHDLGMTVIARGAAESPSDMVKAFVGGSNAVEMDPAGIVFPSSTQVPSVESLLRQMAGALRSGMAAAGAPDLEALKSAQLRRVTRFS